MKKIKSIQQLKNEKNRIAQAQVDLLSKINKNWHELKQLINPTSFVFNRLNKIKDEKDEKDEKDKIGIYSESILKKSFTYTFLLLAEKFADKLSYKIQGILKK